jgi:hypothetical protein
MVTTHITNINFNKRKFIIQDTNALLGYSYITLQLGHQIVNIV